MTLTYIKMSLASLSSGIYSKIGAMFPRAEGTANQTGSNTGAICDAYKFA